MTLKPEQIGDKGQRYQIVCEGYPSEGWHLIGWCNDLQESCRMADGILTAPRATAVRVWERNQNPILRVHSTVVYEKAKGASHE